MRFSRAQPKHSSSTLVPCQARVSEQSQRRTRLNFHTNSSCEGRSPREAFIPISYQDSNEVTLKPDLMQIECTKAVCIFHFAAWVISCSPFRVTEETRGKTMHTYCIRQQTRPERSIINQRSINIMLIQCWFSKVWTLVMSNLFQQSISTRSRKM